MENKIEKTVITAKPDSIRQYFVKIWNYKVLIWVFAKRDLKVKYAQTALGITWSLINPVTATLLFSFFFGFLLNWETENLPFPLYVLTGLIGWNFFSYIVNAGVSSIQESSQLIKKIYFPKAILPLSKVLVALVELSITFAILIPVIIYYGQQISVKVILIPFLLLYNAMCALALAFWISAFAYKKRDVLHVLPFLVYFGIWVTPVFFSYNILPVIIGKYLWLNPMANVVNIWRYLLFDYGAFDIKWVLSFVLVFMLNIAGMYYYNIKENKFSDFV